MQANGESTERESFMSLVESDVDDWAGEVSQWLDEARRRLDDFEQAVADHVESEHAMNASLERHGSKSVEHGIDLGATGPVRHRHESVRDAHERLREHHRERMERLAVAIQLMQATV